MLNKAAKWKGDIAPRAKLKIKVNSILARHCNAIPDGLGTFRVSDGLEGWVHKVKLNEGTCSCRYWELNGIPCPHVIACCPKAGLQPVDVVSDWYKKEKYLLTYEKPLECTRGPEMWVNYEGEKVEAPVMRCKPGRPRVNRFKCRDEIVKIPNGKAKLTKIGVTMHCGNCKSSTHNIRTFPTKGNGQTSGQGKRKRTAGGKTSNGN